MEVELEEELAAELQAFINQLIVPLLVDRFTSEDKSELDNAVQTTSAALS